MPTTHIGRLKQIGIGKESTPGTGVAPTFWLPKNSGNLASDPTTLEDDAGYGSIEKTREIQTVKNMTNIELNLVPRHEFMGNILLALFGLTYACVKFPVSSVSGNFTVGETITESTSGATGVLRRTDEDDGTSPALYIEPVSGTFTGGETLTGGTSSATATGGTIEAAATVRHHVFRLGNNNNHPTFTISADDPNLEEQAAYCMLDTLEFEVVAGDYARITSSWKGKKITTTTGLSPSYDTDEAAFLAKHATFKHAADFDSLTAATAIAVRRFKIVFNKNLLDYQGIGTDDIDSLHNGEFEVSGDMDLKYDSATYRDYVVNSSKQAMRLNVKNTDATTIGTAAKPELQFDMPVVGFTEFTSTSENGQIVEQTLGFKPQKDSARGLTIEAMLVNGVVAGY